MSVGLQPYRSARHLLSAALLLAIAGCAESVTSPLTDERRDVPQYTSHDTEGGPIILMGIDAEDGGPGAHGPISVYVSVLGSLLDAVTNGGTGVLVIGGGKSATDHVTRFWDDVGSGAAVPITYVNGAAAIEAQSLAGFAAIAVASSIFETPSGGLTDAENEALSDRQSAIAAFINAGGGLLALSAYNLTRPYGFLDEPGQLVSSIFSAGGYLGSASLLDRRCDGRPFVLTRSKRRSGCCRYCIVHRVPGQMRLPYRLARSSPSSVRTRRTSGTRDASGIVRSIGRWRGSRRALSFRSPSSRAGADSEGTSAAGRRWVRFPARPCT